MLALRDGWRWPWHSGPMQRLIGIADRTRAWALWARLGRAALLLAAALASRFALAGAESGYPYLTFFASVLLAAVLFGRRIGLLATAAATALAVWFFVPPVGSLRVEDPRDAWAAPAFAATGLAFVLLASAARRALRERDRANAAPYRDQAQRPLGRRGAVDRRRPRRRSREAFEYLRAEVRRADEARASIKAKATSHKPTNYGYAPTRA
jgi:hypothetical protein